ncbi:MAG: 16S rRNA (guanine(966)-N(2))-methyltransferase RsmD [Candidatus Algichlamydia australiensis]|nr:16S rRNA (guanine(966)-N(2))-methyltransferase RsmD [Chlamydiales bacterium]
MGLIKILSGTLRGQSIRTPKGESTRPTTQLVRGALFDICQNRIQDAHLLDLFAGSGAIGIEALSRGAAHITLIENNRTAFQTLKSNIATLALQDQTELYLGDAFKLISRVKRPFDIIYIDPPYKMKKELYLELLQKLDKPLFQNSWIFIEENQNLEKEFQDLKLTHFAWKRVKSYGDTHLHQFQNG